VTANVARAVNVVKNFFERLGFIVFNYNLFGEALGFYLKKWKNGIFAKNK
jgi:hypothetical protein